MNTERLVTMLFRMGLRMVMRKGMGQMMKAGRGKGGAAEGQSAEAGEIAKRAKQTARLNRRL